MSRPLRGLALLAAALLALTLGAVSPELHRLGWFVFQSGVFRWDGGGGVVVLGH